MNSTPVAVCTVCGKYTTSANQINNRCSKRPDGKNRCKGVFGSALSEGDWAQCDACAGTGKNDDGRCECCQGFGVMFVRPK